MKQFLHISFVCLVFPVLAFAQAPVIGTPQWAAAHSQVQRTAGPVYTPQNGNDTLHTIYNNTACGLNYAMTTKRLGMRYGPVGYPQPAGMLVNIPPCAVIDKAYLYTEVLGVTPSITATLVNPASSSANYPMTQIGSSVDVCWSMNGTHVWRADVTASITGPGNYMLSGLPTILSTSSVDVEGATLMVIYSDPSASYTGTLVVDDGCHTLTSGYLTHTMTGINACAASTSATAFMLVGDMQMQGYYLSMNGTYVMQPQWDWWNEISVPTAVTNGQSSSSYIIADNNDCFTLAVAGLYFRTGCSTCTPVTNTLALSTSITPDNCNGNGSATATVTGGSGTYSYTWLPGGQTTSSITGVTAGTYTLYVQDGSACTSATVTIPYTGMTLSTTSGPQTCSSLGTATVYVSGGVGPYSYSWSPSGGTAATATNLTSGLYTVTVTDAGNGNCTSQATAYVYAGTSLTATVSATPESCGNSDGTATAYPNGGTPPYNFLWSPGGQTTPGITGITAGTYTVQITDAGGCLSTNTVTVGATGLQISTGGSGLYSCGDSIQLNCVCSDTTATYSWSPATGLNSTTIASPVSTATANITYTVSVTAACGTVTDTFAVYIDSTNTHNEQICFVTVDTAMNKNIIIWERQNSPANGHYNIYRETSVSGVYALIGSQAVAQFSTYIDATSNPQVMANRYVISTVDTCGIESDTSLHHRSIHLQSSPTGNGGFNLSWTAYEGLPIVTYNIYRGTSISTLTLLTQVAGNVFTYTDLAPPAGMQYYLIEAVHPFGGCTPSFRMSGPAMNPFNYSASISNLNTAVPDGISVSAELANTLLIIPNPGNGNFQLSMSLSAAQEMEISVFDQLGQIVHAQKENAKAGSFTTVMNLSELSSGVYFVQVKTLNGTATKRLVIE